MVSMAQPTHNKYWGPTVRARYGDELATAAEHVRAMLDSPGWAIVEALLEAGKQREIDGLVQGRALEHHQYIAVTRAAFTFEVCQQVGEVVLFEARRAEDERRRVVEAAERRGEA